MPGHEVPTQPVGRQEAGFNIDDRAWAEVAEIGQSERLGEEVEAGLLAPWVDDRQTAAIGSDTVARLGGGEQGVGKGQAGAVLVARSNGKDLGGSLD